MSIGKSVLRLRQEKGLTQGELSRRSRMATSYISRIENNRIQPTMSTLGRIAEALGVSVSSLFELEERVAESEVHKCPVSSTGRCIGDMIRSQHGRLPAGRQAAYTREVVRMLKMTDYIAVHGSRELRRTLTVVLESLTLRASESKEAASPPFP